MAKRIADRLSGECRSELVLLPLERASGFNRSRSSLLNGKKSQTAPMVPAARAGHVVAANAIGIDAPTQHRRARMMFSWGVG
eukprot:6206112-Pleurochrysis_carterae.AAC.1